MPDPASPAPARAAKGKGTRQRPATAQEAVPVAEADRPRELAYTLSEASCLVAVAAVPLYFTLLTPNGFEADKAVLLRVLAVVAGAGWLLGVRWKEWRSRTRPINGMLLLGLLTFAAICLSTLLSIDPRISLWGSTNRQEGLTTWATYVILFTVVATRFREMRKVQQLFNVVVFSSLPIVAYGFAQQLGLDPVPVTGDPNATQWPVRSTLGQHVFFGSYLGLLIPLTAAKLLSVHSRLRDSPRRPATDELLLAMGAVVFTVGSFFLALNLSVHHSPFFALLPLLAVGYALIALALPSLRNSESLQRSALIGCAALLVLQVVVLIESGARGALIGVFAGLPVFGFLLAWRNHRPRIWQGVVAVTAVGAIALVLLNIPGGPLQPLRNVHALSRVTNITEAGGTSGSAQGRLYVWKGTLELFRKHPSIGSAWGGPGRDLLGYGPENMESAFESVYPDTLRRATSENWRWDRAHNIYLDYLVTTGLLGLLLICGLIGFAFWKIVVALRGLEPVAGLIVIGVASALAWHLLDGVFGFETAVTLLLFWMILGLAAALPWRTERPDQITRPSLSSTRFAPVGIFLVLVLSIGGVLLLIPSITDNSQSVAAIWLLSTLIGVAALVAMLLSRDQVVPEASKAARRTRTSVSSSSLIQGLPRGLLLPVALLACLVLASQFRVTAAAMAERAGTVALGSNSVSRSLANLQLASRLNIYDTDYDNQLGAVYLALAQLPGMHLTSSDPGYKPQRGDFRSITPDKVQTLSRNQLYELSEQAYASSVSLQPFDPDPHNNLGKLYLAWKRPQQALAQFQAAARLSPNNPTYLDRQALARRQQHRFKEGLRLAARALNLDSTYWFSHYTAAVLLHDVHRSFEASQEASEALGASKNSILPPTNDQLSSLKSIASNG